MQTYLPPSRCKSSGLSDIIPHASKNATCMMIDTQILTLLSALAALFTVFSEANRSTDCGAVENAAPQPRCE